jgi:hypothetical protein
LELVPLYASHVPRILKAALSRYPAHRFWSVSDTAHVVLAQLLLDRASPVLHHGSTVALVGEQLPDLLALLARLLASTFQNMSDRQRVVRVCLCACAVLRFGFHGYNKDMTRQGKARRGEARQETRQGKTRHDTTRHDNARQETRQGKTRQDSKTRQDKTRQGKARQDKTTQDKTRQGKTNTPDPTGDSKAKQDKTR